MAITMQIMKKVTIIIRTNMVIDADSNNDDDNGNESSTDTNDNDSMIVIL